MLVRKRQAAGAEELGDGRMWWAVQPKTSKQRTVGRSYWPQGCHGSMAGTLHDQHNQVETSCTCLVAVAARQWLG